jgi:hypothetical protein
VVVVLVVLMVVVVSGDITDIIGVGGVNGVNGVNGFPNAIATESNMLPATEAATKNAQTSTDNSLCHGRRP